MSILFLIYWLYKGFWSVQLPYKLKFLNFFEKRFKIFNETTGEIYNLDRWNYDKVYFRYNLPPRVFAKTGERANFNTVSNELLFVNTTLTNSSSVLVFKIYLNNNPQSLKDKEFLKSYKQRKTNVKSSSPKTSKWRGISSRNYK